MAGDWIKMRTDLNDDPAVVAMAGALDKSEYEVVGALHRIWSWADRHTTDGTAPGITPAWLDRYIFKGFAEAIAAVGWIEFDDHGIVFIGFDKHNGKSAKTRAESTVRQRLSRKNRDDGETGWERGCIPRPIVRAVLVRDAHTCVYCGRQSSPEKEAGKRPMLSIDHLIPESRGGASNMANLVTACRDCNSEKNDRTPVEWDLEPTFLQPGVEYLGEETGMSQKGCDKSVTREEKKREEKEEEQVVEIPLRDGTAFSVTKAMAGEWSRAFPRIDVLAELRKARAWSLSNESKQKTRSGAPRFLNTWLATAEADAAKKPIDKSHLPGGGRRAL